MANHKKELNFDVYKCFVFVKIDKTLNKTDVVNAIRGVKHIVTADTVNKYTSKFLVSNPSANYEKVLLKIKMLVNNEGLDNIINNIIAESQSIPGLYQFFIIKRSIEKI